MPFHTIPYLVVLRRSERATRVDPRDDRTTWKALAARGPRAPRPRRPQTSIRRCTRRSTCSLPSDRFTVDRVGHSDDTRVDELTSDVPRDPRRSTRPNHSAISLGRTDDSQGRTKKNAPEWSLPRPLLFPRRSASLNSDNLPRAGAYM